MLRLQKHARPLTAITVATVVALVAFVPSIAAADRSTPAASAAAKKKKKKKQVPLIATVNASFTLRWDSPDGFGGDNGPMWDQLKVTIKNAKIPFRAPNRASASASVSANFTWESEKHTQDYSPWRVGCDRADFKEWGVWGGKTRVAISEVYSMRQNGKLKKYRGWGVIVHPSATGLYTAFEGSSQEWGATLTDGTLDTDCLTIKDNRPAEFLRIDAQLLPGGVYGKLSSDGLSVRLAEIATEADGPTTTIVSGSIKFNTPPFGR